MSPQTRRISEEWRQRGFRLVKFLPIVCGAVVFGYFIISTIEHYRSKEASSVRWTALLFFIPLSVQTCALLFLFVRKANWYYYVFNLGVTTLCFGSCCYFWHRYFDPAQAVSDLQQTSYKTLYVILALLICVGIMTYSIMRPSSDHLGGKFCDNLNSGVRDHPFWAVMFFLTLFFGVAYLFGFTLAFHDKYALAQVDKDDPDRHRPALRMVNLKSIDDLTESIEIEDANRSTNNKEQSAPVRSLIDNSKEVDRFAFYFRSGEARLGREELTGCIDNVPPKRQWNRDISQPKANEKFNDCNLRGLVKKIQDKTAGGKRIRVSLIGHGDGDPVSRRPNSPSSKPVPPLHYLSNYELSEARAENVKYEILQMFSNTEKWHNVEWLILPASNEDVKEIKDGLIAQNLFQVNELGGTFTQDEIAKGISTEELAKRTDRSLLLAKLDAKLTPERLAEESRVVLASVTSVPDHFANLEMKQISQEIDGKTLGLMDYMYFSIYTITTTGYGDIVPTTAYGKFVTSLANFCEVLFLVVFFNALVSLKRNPPNPNATREVPALQGSPDSCDEVVAGEVDAPRKVVRGNF